MKRKKITFFLIAVLIIFGNSLFFTLSAVKINNWRIKKAENLYSQSISEANPKKRMIFLIQSDFLRPNDDKKLEIADLYLKSDDFENAKVYLNRVESEKGYLKYAESALEIGEFEIASEYTAKIKGDETRHELEIFQNITKDEKNVGQITEIPLTPVTNLGIVLKAINTRDYYAITDNTLLGTEIVKIRNKERSKLATELEIADLLTIKNQPILARIMINAILNDHSNLTDAYIIRANSYRMQGNYQEALKAQLQGVNTNPSDISLYKTALDYAHLSNNEPEMQWLKDNIAYLESIKG